MTFGDTRREMRFFGKPPGVFGSRCARAIWWRVWGGDEFAVLLGGLHPEREVAALEARTTAEKIRISLARPFEVGAPIEGGEEGHFRHLCPPSLGVALFGGEGPEKDQEVFGAADRALYRAKGRGGNTVVVAGEELSAPS